MAIFTPGPAVAGVSGSVGGTTFSRNRGGPYMRRRAIPSNPSSVYQQTQRARIALFSQSWAALSQAQRLQWANWAGQNNVVNALGNQITLSGHQAYVRLNSRLNAAGDTAIDSPPVGAAPAGITTLSATWDIGAGAFALTFTPTPIGAANRLVVWAVVVNSAGINYVGNLWKQVTISALDQATGLDTQSVIESRFGSLVADQHLAIKVAVHDSATGLRSLPTEVAGAVVST